MLARLCHGTRLYVYIICKDADCSIVYSLTKLSRVVHEPEGKAAVIWILGHYGDALPDSPYMLEKMVNKFESEVIAVKMVRSCR